MPTPVLHVIANARSGQGLADDVRKAAEAACGDAGCRLQMHLIDDPAKLPDITRGALDAARADGGTIAVAGGDGTVRSVGAALIGSEVPMAVVPSGTFNFFARDHGIPESIEAAVHVAVHGALREVPAAYVNDEVFLVNASLGLYAQAIRERESRIKRFGRRRLIATLSTIATLLTRQRGMDVAIERAGVLVHARTPTVFVGNNALQLRELALDVCQCVEDQRLAVMVMRPVGPAGMIKLLLMAMFRRLRETSELTGFCADTLTVHRNRRHCTVALDGELMQLRYPLHFRSLPNALRLRVPQAPAEVA